jgi:hypothetical protein
MSVDLRAEKSGGSWVRCFGDHEEKGVHVSVNNISAHVTIEEVGITFEVDRDDLPAAWDSPIDVDELRAELISAVVTRMTGGVLKELFREIREQRQRAFWEGEHAAKAKIREALDL